MEKLLNTRHLQKYDTASNWELHSSFIPKAGEIIVYSSDETTSYPRVKIGNGISTVADLPFVN